ncbi:response regulator transcription factor [Thermoflexus sp.]|jgi:DNA-binding NarL/FixJ family response regulator|uniref:response regulator n=1 Tax=Thermoflexus sp. TaxID=1969742 RepID=UPI002607B3A2|nr:response regulator transcription factor [Thermoflexus sp.]
MGIRILIADDHAIVRAGIRALLQLYPDFEVVGEAADGHEAILQTRRLQPDIVLMDIGMPGMDGLAATREIVRVAPRTRVLILSQHENREYVMPALRAGASGYVLKRAPDETLIRAIRAVHAGETYMDPRLTDLLVEEVRRSAEGPTDPLETLSEREREILVLLAQGKSYQEIAQTLFISVKTVDFHRANLMRKLGLKNRAELVQFAMRRGLI